MLREEHLSWDNDADCVRVAECVIGWLQADLTAPTPETVGIEAKDVSLYAFLTDILCCVTDDRHKADAKALLAQIGQ